jgi:hypothetical protein
MPARPRSSTVGDLLMGDPAFRALLGTSAPGQAGAAGPAGTAGPAGPAGTPGTTVSVGKATAGAITSGATADLAVTLSKAMPNTTYAAVATLSGTGIGNAAVQGITARTTTTATVRIKATAAVTNNTVTVEVLASAG